MVTPDDDDEPETGLSLALSVWTPTPDELAIHTALVDQLTHATTPRARREARQRIDKHFREMQHRHRDDPPAVSVDPAADEALRALQIEELQKQLRDLDNHPPPAPDGSASSN